MYRLKLHINTFMKKRINYRQIWISYHGKIPKDSDGRSFDIHHLDSNSDNNSVDNLIAVSAYDHYCIHRDKGEYGAAAMIAKRMKVKPEDLSETVKLQMKELVQSGKHNFSVKGFVSVRDKDGNAIRVRKDDPRYLSGELVGVNAGYVVVKDIHNTVLRVSKSDPRIKTGELVGINAGFVTVKDTNGNNIRIKNTDPRFISGELKSVVFGTFGNNNGKTWKHKNKRPIVRCPYCAKEGDISPMKQHHFDNCKHKG